jgi:hypothetical protein
MVPVFLCAFEFFPKTFPKTAPVKLIPALQLHCPEWSMKRMKEGISGVLFAAQK